MSYREYGIDVSKWQGTINWEQTASELKRVNNGSSGFAIIRAGYSNRGGNGGLVTDPQFSNNLSGAKLYCVPVGIYWYCYDRNPAAAMKTATELVNLLKGGTFEYPIYLDMEYEACYTGKDGSGRSTSQVKADNTAIITAALGILEAAGYYAALYCSRNFFLSYTNLAELSGFDKWEAAYTSTDSAAVSNGLWQFSSKNALGIAGFGTSLDCDVSYRDYPSIIKAAGLNGYSKDEARTLYTIMVTASRGDKNKVVQFCTENEIPYEVQ